MEVDEEIMHWPYIVCYFFKKYHNLKIYTKSSKVLEEQWSKQNADRTYLQLSTARNSSQTLHPIFASKKYKL